MIAGIFNFGSNSTQWHAKKDKNALCQGSNIIRRCCEAAGFQIIDLNVSWQRVDVLMVSLFWWEHVYDLIVLLSRRGIEYRREGRNESPVIFAGGQLPSYNPSALMDFIDLACIGDGEQVAPAVLEMLSSGSNLDSLTDIPGVFVSRVDNRAVWQHIEDISATLKYPFYNETRYETFSGVKRAKKWERRIEIARGCRRKCLFCGLSWTKKYRENNTSAIVKEIKNTVGCLKAFAPSPAEHSGWSEICDAYDSVNKYNQSRDLATDVILNRGFGKSRSYSTGIDGLSERLRSALCKPLSKVDLRRVIELANGHMGSLGIYLILDLPGQTDDDYREWFETLAAAEIIPSRKLSKTDISRGFSAERFYMIVTLNAFCPTPHTPLQWAGINYRSDLTGEYMRHIDILGDMKTRRLKHKLLGRAHGSSSRILESAILRGGPDLGKFIQVAAKQRSKFNGPAGPAKIFAIARALGVYDNLVHTMEEKDAGEELPWVKRVETMHSQAVLKKAWYKYKNRMEL